MKDIPIAFIDDETLYESENYVNFKLEEKGKEIKRLNNIINKIECAITKPRAYTSNHYSILKNEIQQIIGSDNNVKD